MPASLNITGVRFGRLIAVQRAGTQCGNALWACKCDCGAQTMATVCNLRFGEVKSCGCLAVDATCAKNLRHGLLPRGALHPLYWTWSNMIQRCTNPQRRDYVRYGGRGIRVCASWRRSFVAFLDYIGVRPSPTHSIDRIDNEGNYEPGNVRWATRAEQRANQRPRRRP